MSVTDERAYSRFIANTEEGGQTLKPRSEVTAQELLREVGAVLRMSEAEAARLDRLLEAGGLEIIGGTALFRLAAHERAAELFADLLAARIYVRRFAHDPRWLRFGLPACAADSARLGAVLAGFAAGARR